MTTTTRSSLPLSIPLVYTIASSTPHSGKYVPENVMVDKPQDQSSRWSGAFQGNATDQWIILRLDSLSILEKITFGKFSKPHPCNVKEIKVFAGITAEHMSEVLHTGLKNDTTAETFNLQYVNSAGVCIPTRFVKIMPMLAHGQNFHISIWHIAMAGISDSNYVEEIRMRYNEYRETAVLRHVLKHLRQRRLLTPYQTILSRADVQLEHPLVTQLHESLVLRGDWSQTEKLLDVLSSSGLFECYLQSCQPHAMWTRLLGTDADGDVPPARGGHAMCIDPVNEMIYIFGGWDGEKSMDDFWVYSIKEDKWRVLSHSTSKEQNAPGARSCHKMVFDTKTGSIYLLGRLNDADGLRAPVPSNARTLAGASAGPSALPQQQHQQQPSTTTSTSEDTTPKSFCSEFYRYHTRGVDSGKWDFLAFDTASSGGPPLMFDHQMAMDCEAQILYVFGGRVLDGDWDTSRYSGLYSYNVRTSRWRSLQLPETLGTQGHPVIPPRFGHSMVLDPASKTLYIFAGQRDERYLSDMYSYDLNTGVAKEIFSNFSSAGGPDACFTQRAVIDPTLKELYVFCGLTRNATTSTRNTLRAYLSNWVYRYDTQPGKWTQILRQPDRPVSESPLPRFAHQVAYNPFTRSVFLHGGNAGNMNESTKGSGVKAGRDADGDGFGFETEDGRDAPVAGIKERRLDDFWRMELKRPGPEEIVRQAKFQIRRQQFREMCEEAPPVRALNFLQNEVSSVVDHRSTEEAEMFRSLLTHLLAPAPVPPHTTEKIVSTSTSTSSHRHSLSDSSNSSTTTTSLEHEDSRESSSRPRKRSRADPEEGSEGGIWTNEIAEDDSQGYSNGGSMQRLQDMVDPLEAMILGEGGGGAHPEPQSQLTGARYTQRTEVFEHLLKFIADSEKQPSDSLLDLVGGDRRFRSQF